MASVHPEQEYFAHLAEGRFMLQRSASTGGYVFYPRVAEPGTGATDLEWVEASGRGMVYASTVVRQRPPADDYNVVLVDLAEGPRMMSRVDGLRPDEVRIGLRVRARVLQDPTDRCWCSFRSSHERTSARQDRHRRGNDAWARRVARLQRDGPRGGSKHQGARGDWPEAARCRCGVRGAARDSLSGLGFAEYLGIRPKLTENNRTGGSSFFTHAIHAALALDAGQCDVALIAYGSNQRSAAGKLITSLRTPAYEAPYRLPRPIGAYALAATRYMHQYGAMREALARWRSRRAAGRSSIPTPSCATS